MSAKKTLNPKSQQLLRTLCDAAKSYGWQEDQGTGPSVDAARLAYEASFQDLTAHLLDLEATVRRLRARVSTAQFPPEVVCF